MIFGNFLDTKDVMTINSQPFYYHKFYNKTRKPYISNTLEVEFLEDRIVYEYNLAGTKKESISINIEDDYLVIGINEKEHSKNKINFSYSETRATYEDGILKIEFIKEKPKPIKIEIE